MEAKPRRARQWVRTELPAGGSSDGPRHRTSTASVTARAWQGIEDAGESEGRFCVHTVGNARAARGQREDTAVPETPHVADTGSSHA